MLNFYYIINDSFPDIKIVLILKTIHNPLTIILNYNMKSIMYNNYQIILESTTVQ